MKNKIHLKELYSFNPYENDKEQIERIINYDKYIRFFEEFDPFFKDLNKSITDKYFKNFLNYPKQIFDLLNPTRLFFSLFLKSLILDKLLKKHPDKKIVIEIDEADSKFNLNNLSPNTNIYGLIANYTKDGFEIKIKKSNFIKPNFDTTSSYKILNLLDLRFDEFFQIILSKVFFWKKKFILIGDNYRLREIISHLFYNGYSPIRFDDTINKIFIECKNNVVVEEELTRNVKKLININIYPFLKLNLKSKSLIESIINIYTEIISYRISLIMFSTNKFRNLIYELKKKNQIKFSITSVLNKDIGILLYDSLNQNNIKSFSVEHGMTTGISKDGILSQFKNETNYSDILLTYNEVSKETHIKTTNNSIKVESIGGSYKSKNLKFKIFKKFILKRKYALKDDRYVLYVSHSIEPGTGKDYPFTKSNFEIFNDELMILDTLSKSNKKIIYKPHFYSEISYNKRNVLKRIVSKYDNIDMFTSDEDFRYIRSIADIIVTNSKESTLEWCIGADVPLFILDSKYYEPIEKTKVKKVFDKAFFLFNYDNDGWHRNFINKLNNPYSKIIKEWSKKSKYRKMYDNYCLLSNKKNSGKIGSKIILKNLGNS